MKLTILRRARKDLERLPKLKQLIVDQKLRGLAQESLVTNIETLSGYKNIFRVGVGDYRIVYQRTVTEIIIIVIAHRKEAYKLLERLLG